MKAARTLRDWTFKDLAAALPAEAQMGERVLRRLEGGEASLRPTQLREIAAALGLPYRWFTAPTIEGLLKADEPEPGTTDERLERLERWMAEQSNGDEDARPTALPRREASRRRRSARS